MKSNRQQWLVLNHDSPVGSSIAKYGFARDRNLGFELIEITPEVVRARFIERIETVEEMDTPFGDIEKFKLVRYIYFDFTVVRVSDGVSLVKIIKPPVSVKSFVSTLMMAFGYSATLRKVSFNLLSVYTSISQDAEVDRLTVSRITISQVPLGERATSRMEIFSTDNALVEFMDVYDAPSMKIEKIMINVRIKHQLETLELTAAGSICCTPGLEGYLERTIINQ